MKIARLVLILHLFHLGKKYPEEIIVLQYTAWASSKLDFFQFDVL